MLIVTTTLTRPNTDVTFYNHGTAWKDYMKATYQDTGKQASPESIPGGAVVWSQDMLTCTLTAHWRSMADNSEFLVDPTADAMKAARAAYSAEHGIQVVLTRQVVFDEFDLESDNSPS